MSRLSPLPPVTAPSDLHRSQSAVSIAGSETTYHSFYDVELYKPTTPATATVTELRLRPREYAEEAGGEELAFQPPAFITRHDSGYESVRRPSSSRARTSTAATSYSSHRRNSLALMDGSSHSRRQQHSRRPFLHRSVKSTPPGSHPSLGRLSGSQVRLTTSHQQQYRHPDAYFHFPPLETTGSAGGREQQQEVEQRPQPEDLDPVYPPPPQTTHYWTSDHTRRLEYAAIDAATQGFKGWVMRHIVPDCFVPKENRRLAFDDDSGSVRRYRLELECEDKEGKSATKKKLGWLLGR